MYENLLTPPLFSYLLAAWGELFGLQEISCHIFQLLVALAATAGIFFLADEFECDPFLVTLLSIVSPLFILSATVVMCDLLMLTFWIWSLLAWLKALKRDSIILFLVSSILAAACLLTKYNGAFLLILLGTAGFLHRCRIERHLLWLCVPVAALILYWLAMSARYHMDIGGNTASYIDENRSFAPLPVFRSVIAGIVFSGAILAGVFPFLFFALKRKEVIGIVVSALVLEFIFSKTGEPSLPLWSLQHGMWLVAGVALLWLATREIFYRNDRIGILLFLWLGLAGVFSVGVNWCVNGRSLITLIPAVGLLVARAESKAAHFPRRLVLVCLLPMIIFSCVVSSADYEMASINKNVATTINDQFNQAYLKNRSLWFEGHWGFQYYMDRQGVQALDVWDSIIKPDDILIFPVNLSDLYIPRKATFITQKKLSIPHSLPVTVMNKFSGAGYYGAFGDLPFVFGMKATEDVDVLMFTSAQHGIAD